MDVRAFATICPEETLSGALWPTLKTTAMTSPRETLSTHQHSQT